MSGGPPFALPADAPLGVLDSGLGGLTVVREMLHRLPGERLVYVGDTAHAPYGSRSQEEIRALSLGIARFLIERWECRGIVVACNTATAAAAEALRASLPIPVVAMEPAVKPAAAVTRTGKVGILATVGTLASARFAALLSRYKSGGVEFLTQPCPGLVEAIEEGRTGTPETRALIEKYIAPLVAQGADTLVLGCTHYPVLRPLISEVAGPGVTLIDTGEAVARRAAELFGAVAGSDRAAELLLHTTGDMNAFARGAAYILDTPATEEPLRVCPLHWKNGELTSYGTN